MHETKPGSGLFSYREKKNKWERKEILWAQKKARQDEEAIRVYSAAHAGEGQLVFGGGKNNRVDLVKAKGGGKFEILQFHESAHNQVNGHLEECAIYDGEEPVLNYATLRSDSFNRSYAKYLTNHTHLEISYSYETECLHFHDNEYNLYDEMEGKKEYVITPQWVRNSRDSKPLSESELEEAVMSGKAGGFIVIG